MKSLQSAKAMHRASPTLQAKDDIYQICQLTDNRQYNARTRAYFKKSNQFAPVSGVTSKITTATNASHSEPKKQKAHL